MTIKDVRAAVNQIPWLDSTKDKPEHGETVLVKSKYGVEIVDYFAENYMDPWSSYVDDAPGFYDFNDETFDYYKLDNVRYWLPLPKGEADDCAW